MRGRAQSRLGPGGGGRTPCPPIVAGLACVAGAVAMLSRKGRGRHSNFERSTSGIWPHQLAGDGPVGATSHRRMGGRAAADRLLPSAAGLPIVASRFATVYFARIERVATLAWNADVRRRRSIALQTPSSAPRHVLRARLRRTSASSRRSSCVNSKTGICARPAAPEQNAASAASPRPPLASSITAWIEAEVLVRQFDHHRLRHLRGVPSRRFRPRRGRCWPPLRSCRCGDRRCRDSRRRACRSRQATPNRPPFCGSAPR